MTAVRERYRPQPMSVDASYKVRGGQIGGFLCKTAGTLTVTAENGTVLVDAQPLTAGVYTPLPFALPTAEGATVVLAGGASGTLAI
jgi:hypothetical protein